MFKKKIVKFFTKTLVGRITDKALLGGAIQSTNVVTNNTNNGEVDVKEIILELLTSTLPILLVVSLIFGWLDLETVKDLVKILIP